MGKKSSLPNMASEQLLSLIQAPSQASPLSHAPCPTPCKRHWAIPNRVQTLCSFLFLHFTKTLSELPSWVINLLHSIYQAFPLPANQKCCSKSPQATVQNMGLGWSSETNRKGPSDFRAEAKKQRRRIAVTKLWLHHRSPLSSQATISNSSITIFFLHGKQQGKK